MSVTGLPIDVVCRGTLIRDAAKALDEAGLRLCVLHGSDGYPNVDSDLDAVCADPRRIPAVLAERNRSVIVQAIEHERDAIYYVLHGTCAHGSAFAALDVSADYRRNGRVLYSGSDLARSCRPQGEIDRPSPAVEFVCYLIKKVLKTDLRAEHVTELSNLYTLDPRGSQRELGRFFADPSVRIVARAAAEDDWTEVRARIADLRRELLDEVGSRNRLGTFRYWWDDARRRVRRMMRPTGMFVLIDGPDRSQVAAVIGGIEPAVAPAFRRTVRDPLTPGRGLGGFRERAWMYVTLYSLLVRSTLVLLDEAHAAEMAGGPPSTRRPSSGWASVLRRMPPSWGLKVFVGSPQSQHSTPSSRSMPIQDGGRSGWHVVDGSLSVQAAISEVEHVVVRHMVRRTARRLNVGAGS
jgi:hypothetical protein